MEVDKVRRLGGGSRKGSRPSKCPPLGVSGSWGCPGANLFSLVSQEHEQYWPLQLAKLLPYHLGASRRGAFCLQPEKLSPERSCNQCDEEVPQPQASECQPCQ